MVSAPQFIRFSSSRTEILFEIPLSGTLKSLEQIVPSKFPITYSPVHLIVLIREKSGLSENGWQISPINIILQIHDANTLTLSMPKSPQYLL